MDAQTTALSVLLVIAGVGIGWRFRNHENGKVRGSAWAALTGGVVLLLILIWKLITG